jgi:uncharacterized protein with HEPN domain
MREPRPTVLFLQDILDAATDIRSFTRGMSFEDFAADKRTRLAVIRCLEVVGEAVKNLPGDLRQAHPEVDWQSAAGMRDVLIDAYHGTSERVIWDTVTGNMPRFEEQVRAILEGLGREG